MKRSRKTLSALEAVLDIAYHAGGESVQSTDITRRQGIPRRYLEPVMQRLVRDGILVATRGPRGGYRLARERRRITLGEIVRIVRQMETAVDPIEEQTGSELGIHVLHPLWCEIEEAALKKFDQITLEDMCQRSHQAGIQSEAAKAVDFSI